jgi:hypothetical protein
MPRSRASRQTRFRRRRVTPLEGGVRGIETDYV